MTTIRQLNSRGYAVIVDGKERARFTTGRKANNFKKAEAWVHGRRQNMDVGFDRDAILFQTEPHGTQVVCHITNDGENDDVKPLGAGSLVRVADDSGRAVVMTGEELDSLALKWLALRKLRPGKAGR